MLDLVYRVDTDHKVDYVWFDTGLEYQATKDHLEYLEDRYSIEIIRAKPRKPIPVAVKEYGQPFLSKRTSQVIHRLQLHDFQWEDLPYEQLMAKYPGVKYGIQWWCNEYGFNSRFNIANFKWLKEFMIENPPTFKISDQCCEWSKKKVVHQILKEGGYNLNIYGVRKAEGGNRATAYKNCFTAKDQVSEYRPLFWYRNSDKDEYEDMFDIVHSKCYTEYGLKRTGCVGCPFSKYMIEEYEMLETWEPKLAKAAFVVFKDSYEYTQKYRQFRDEMDAKYEK